MSEMHRLNTRVSFKTNEWLDKKSLESGISKSALVNLAVESYIEQKEIMDKMSDMNELVQAVQRLEKRIEDKDLAD